MLRFYIANKSDKVFEQNKRNKMKIRSTRDQIAYYTSKWVGFWFVWIKLRPKLDMVSFLVHLRYGLSKGLPPWITSMARTPHQLLVPYSSPTPCVNTFFGTCECV